LSAALYKEKLKQMIEMMKEATICIIREDWTPKEGEKCHRIDIVREASNLFIKIVLTCLFGEGYLEAKVEQKVNGK